MTRIESIEDDMKGIVTYELRDGTRVAVDARAARECGAFFVLHKLGYGHLLPTERVPVIWHGQRVGTLPSDFDPLNTKSRNFFYDPRPGDFRRDGDTWIANRTLGPGDLESVAGFAWDRPAANSSGGITSSETAEQTKVMVPAPDPAPSQTHDGEEGK